MKASRKRITFTIAALLVVALVYLLWPRPMAVDMGAVERQAMIVTIDEEARTRVEDNYVVSAPVSGRLMRVDVDPGDPVEGQATIVARILPSDPAFLDLRAQTAAESAVRSAEAAVAMARAEVTRAIAERDYAAAEVERVRKLREADMVSEAALDRAELAMRSANAQLRTSRAAVAAREAELENARALLISPTEAEAPPPSNGDADEPGVFYVRAPVSGCVLRVIQESETVVAAGAPLLEVGDLNSDLEVVAEYLSTDAVRIKKGDRVIIDKWGGDEPLSGVVENIEPFGFTKYSALGVEEQRVNVVIDFVSPVDERQGLGHGFRVEARTVVWENENALVAPSSALFRNGGEWSVYAVENGRARRKTVEIGQNNGVQVEIIGGLGEGEQVILYPSNQLADGKQVTRRKIG